jgi:hypothetical protein
MAVAVAVAVAADVLVLESRHRLAAAKTGTARLVRLARQL